MKVNSITRLVLGSILVIFSKPTLLNSALSLSDERVDRPRTARGKHPGKLLVRDPFTKTPDLTRQKSVPVLRIRGQTPAKIPPGQDYMPEFNRLPDVSVTCSSKGFVLRVKKSFYGFSAVAEELTLGETCKSNGVLEPHKDLLFTYALTDCQSKQQVVPDYVVYKYVLRYVPLSHRNPFIYHRVNVDVECRYKRNHHVHSLMINPTLRTPLHKVIRSRSGDFRIQLMDAFLKVFKWDGIQSLCSGSLDVIHTTKMMKDPRIQVDPISGRTQKKYLSQAIDLTFDLLVQAFLGRDSWSSPVRSAVYLLGQNVNVQISTRHHYPGVKLFINSCYVATVNTLSQATKYSIIDNYGCLQESRINPGASRFRFSRADNVVQFSFGAFQFIEAPDAQVSLHCEASVSSVGPGPMQKSCFYRHPDKRWISVFGQDSVCDCCDSICNQTKTKRIIYEGFVSSDQVLFSDTSMASSTLNATLMAYRNDDTIWFEAKLAKEPQRSYIHEDFVASVTLISSEETHDKSQPSRTSTVELIEEEMKEMEKEKHGDVEILMAVISKSFVGSERPDLDFTEQFDVESLSLAGKGKMRDMNKGLSYWPKTVQRMESSMKTSVMMVNETMEQRSKINESALGEWKLHDVLLPSFISEQKNKEDVGSSENKKERLDFLLIDVSSNDEKFPAESDELVEQGLVRKLDFMQDSDDYYFSEGV